MGWIWIALVAAVVLWLVLVFNGLIRSRNQVRAAASDIDVQLTRRHDLVPQLVAAVKGYASHESATLEAVTVLRERAQHAHGYGERAPVENALGDGVQRLIALAEAYPDLKATSNFAQLTSELVEVEEHLQYSRRFYNGAVRQLNDRIQRFPDLLVARPLGFREAEFYSDTRAGYDAAPQIQGVG